MPPLLAYFYRGIILGSGWPEAHYVCSSGTHLVRAWHCQTPAEGSTTSSWLCQQGVQGGERPFRRPFGGLAWACLEHLSFQLRSRVSRSLCHENDPQKRKHSLPRYVHSGLFILNMESMQIFGSPGTVQTVSSLLESNFYPSWLAAMKQTVSQCCGGTGGRRPWCSRSCLATHWVLRPAWGMWDSFQNLKSCL